MHGFRQQCGAGDQPDTGARVAANDCWGTERYVDQRGSQIPAISVGVRVSMRMPRGELVGTRTWKLLEQRRPRRQRDTRPASSPRVPTCLWHPPRLVRGGVSQVYLGIRDSNPRQRSCHPECSEGSRVGPATERRDPSPQTESPGTAGRRPGSAQDDNNRAAPVYHGGSSHLIKEEADGDDGR